MSRVCLARVGYGTYYLDHMGLRITREFRDINISNLILPFNCDTYVIELIFQIRWIFFLKIRVKTTLRPINPNCMAFPPDLR